MPSQKYDKDNSVKVVFIKIVIKINILKIYIKNTLFITRKCNITRIFIKLEYIFICVQSSKNVFNHLTCNKPIRNKFQCCWRIINSFITHSLSFTFFRTIYYEKRIFRKDFSERIQKKGFLTFCADLSKKSKSVKAIYINASESSHSDSSSHFSRK